MLSETIKFFPHLPLFSSRNLQRWQQVPLQALSTRLLLQTDRSCTCHPRKHGLQCGEPETVPSGCHDWQLYGHLHWWHLTSFVLPCRASFYFLLCPALHQTHHSLLPRPGTSGFQALPPQRAKHNQVAPGHILPRTPQPSCFRPRELRLSNPVFFFTERRSGSQLLQLWGQPPLCSPPWAGACGNSCWPFPSCGFHCNWGCWGRGWGNHSTSTGWFLEGWSWSSQSCP